MDSCKELLSVVFPYKNPQPLQGYTRKTLWTASGTPPFLYDDITAPLEVKRGSHDGLSLNSSAAVGFCVPSKGTHSGQPGQWTRQVFLPYLFGPCRLLTGTHALFVMVQRLLLQRPLLLPLVLEGNQVVSLLLQLPLQPFCLSLFLQLFALIFLPRAGRAKKSCDHRAPQHHTKQQQNKQWRQNRTENKQNSKKGKGCPQ